MQQLVVMCLICVLTHVYVCALYVVWCVCVCVSVCVCELNLKQEVAARCHVSRLCLTHMYVCALYMLCVGVYGLNSRQGVEARTGWRRHIGCLKLPVIFCTRATEYMALLWKMTYTDKAS